MKRDTPMAAPRRAMVETAEDPADLATDELDELTESTPRGTRFADDAAPGATAFARPAGGRRRLGAAMGIGALALAVTGTLLVSTNRGQGSDTVAEPVTTSTSAATSATPSARQSDPQIVSRDLERQPLPAAPTEVISQVPSASPSPASSASSSAASPSASSSKQSSEEPQLPLGPIIGSRYATTALNVRTSPTQNAGVIKTIEAGTQVQVSATVKAGFRQISVQGAPAWVKDQYLSKSKPSVSDSGSGSGSGSISAAACSSGSAVENGLVSNAIKVHRAVCSRYPSITSYGGLRGSGDFHGTGQALDIMVSGELGWQVARWLRANAGTLGVTQVIYSQQIWTTQRSGEGWRPMSNRGSATANHYDHVHVSVR